MSAFPDTSGRAGAEDAAVGWCVARQACEHPVATLGDRLVLLYAIGSLAHGCFSLAVSHVDVAVFVDRSDEGVPGIVAAIVESTRRELGEGLADRLSMFYGDWGSFGSPPESARLGAIDRLDLMDHGVLMMGADRRARDGARPTREELIAESAAFLRYWLTQRRGIDDLIAAGPRVLTKNVLFPVRFLYTHATGRAGSNQDAVSWYSDLGGPHATLAIAALRWRTGDIDPVSARWLLERHLDGVYAECCEVYGGRRTYFTEAGRRLLICAAVACQERFGVRLSGCLTVGWCVGAVGRGVWCARAPSLISVRDPEGFRVGDMMVDGGKRRDKPVWSRR